ncbi:hypothetical protein LMH87_007335 [Akanthomyces muscarius]|uniref:Uncharacterized protein n=1 Tax=Akanthomyces muscarius TaxID=2231603 RepID=A0A9W8UU33_AKAMU|nr:hypothetical protein LMH87_007335 [Akanthomyces muscarius]KAJ4165714.1 hypothetical protein LMH87_007335 [Akanthomyces muscarius]
MEAGDESLTSVNLVFAPEIMKFAAAVVAFAAAAVVAVPTGKYLVELSLPDAQDYNPNQSLYPQRSLRVIGAFESYYTEETFRTEAIKQCKAEHACSTVIGYLQERSNVVDGSPYPVWFAWLIGGAQATTNDFHHAKGTKNSFIYTINE